MFCHLQNLVTGAFHKSKGGPGLPPPRPMLVASIIVQNRDIFSKLPICNPAPFRPELEPFSCICSTTRWFHWCKMVCRAWFQSMFPTTWRKSWRHCTSSFRSSDFYNLRWSDQLQNGPPRVQGSMFVTQIPFVRMERFRSSLQTLIKSKRYLSWPRVVYRTVVTVLADRW